MAFSCCFTTVVSGYTPSTHPAGGHSGATSRARQGAGLIPVGPQPLDSLHFPPPSQLSPYLCQPRPQWPGKCPGKVNYDLLRELTHMAYSSIEDASLAVHALGQGAQLAKIDIRDAYRIIPVHPEDWLLSWVITHAHPPRLHRCARR